MTTISGKTVLVTGGAGFIGVPTVARLREAGVDVVVLDNLSETGPERLYSRCGADVRLLEADIRNHDGTVDAIKAIRPWAVVHLAALHFIPFCVANPHLALDTNVTGFANVLAGCDEAGVSHVIFASTGDVYQPSATPHAEHDLTGATSVYALSKLAGESLLTVERSNGADYTATVARIFNVYGPGDTVPHLIPDIFHDVRVSDRIRLGNLTTKRDFIFVEDLAGVLVELLTVTPENGCVNIGTGVGASATEIVEEVGRITGRAIEIVSNEHRLRKYDRPLLVADTSRLFATFPKLVLSPLYAGLQKIIDEDMTIASNRRLLP